MRESVRTRDMGHNESHLIHGLHGRIAYSTGICMCEGVGWNVI